MTERDQMYGQRLSEGQAIFIAELVDAGYGNREIVSQFEDEYGVRISDRRVCQIRRGKSFKYLTEDKYLFAKEGYPLFEDYKEILENRKKEEKADPIQLTFDKYLSKEDQEKLKSTLDQGKKEINKNIDLIKSKLGNAKQNENGDIERDTTGPKREGLADRLINKVFNLFK